MAVPGGQILGGLEGAAAFWVATGQGFAAGMVASRGDLKAGLLGATTAGAFWGVGEAFQQNLTPGWMGAEDTTWRLVSKTVIHGAIGGTASDWAGGSFTDGFLGAATNQALGDMLLGEGGEPIFRVGGAALIGGTAAELGGGKFANGAITAAFGQAFNEQGGGHGKYLNSRADCPGRCTLVTNPDGTKMYVSSGVSDKVVAANAKGSTLAEEQSTLSLKDISPIIDTITIIFPQVKVVQGGALLLDLSVSAVEQSFGPMIGRGAGGVVKIPLRRASNLSEKNVQRVGAGTDAAVDQMTE